MAAARGTHPAGLVSAIRAAVPDDVLGRVWWDGRRVVVAVVGDRDPWRSRLGDLDHGDLVRVVAAPRSLRDLERIVARVVRAADRVGAPLSTVGVDEQCNVVEVGLESLEVPALRALHGTFADEPVRFIEERVEPA